MKTRYLLILLLLYVGYSNGQPPLSVMIFTDKSHTVDTSGTGNIPIQYYQMDAVEQLLQSLNFSLKNLSQAQAEQTAKDYLAQHDEEFKKGLEGLIKARQLKLAQYPAIVFDKGKAVIYGGTSLYQAMMEYQQWQTVTH